jgi:hypothetical protein
LGLDYGMVGSVERKSVSRDDHFLSLFHLGLTCRNPSTPVDQNKQIRTDFSTVLFRVNKNLDSAFVVNLL